MKYIFFDLDNTLIDFQTAQNKAIESLYYIYKFDNIVNVEEFIKRWNDLSDYHYDFYTRKEISYEEQRNRRVIDLFNGYNLKLDKTPKEIFDIYLKSFEENWTLFDDVYNTIEKLYDSGYKLGIISNGDLSQQTAKLKKTGIYNFFEIIATSSEYEYSKPNPKLYETIIQQFNINKEEIIMIGDQADKDVIPCLNIGIKAIWINRTEKNSEENIPKIKKLNELFDFLKQTNNIKIKKK